MNEFKWDEKNKTIQRLTYQPIPKAKNSPLSEIGVITYIDRKEGNPIKMPFQEFLDTKIPRGVEQFVAVFPQFICFTGESWDKCLLENTSPAKRHRLIALVNGYSTKDDGNQLVLDKYSPVKPVGPIKFVLRFLRKERKNQLPKCERNQVFNNEVRPNSPGPSLHQAPPIGMASQPTKQWALLSV